MNTPTDLAAMYKAQRDNLLAFCQNAPVSSGVCCCGDSMERHDNPMNCGHSPVDQWDNCIDSFTREFAAADAKAGVA